MRIILLIGGLVLYSLQWSCSKSGGQISYHSIYHKTGIQAESKLLVFSNQGQITDPYTIGRYIAMDGDGINYYSNSLIDPYNHYQDSIEFIDPTHAKLLVDQAWVNCDLIDQFPLFILTRKDTTTSNIDYDPYSQSLRYWISQFKPEIYQEWLISSTRGYYLFGYTAREKYVYKISGTQLCAQMTLFVNHNLTGYVNNFMDEKFYLNLPAGDTISVQSYSLKYER